MNNTIEKFRNEIRMFGLEPPLLIEPGKYHRFPGFDKTNHNRAAWCLLYPDMNGGSFGDFSSGILKRWRLNEITWLSVAEKEAFTKQVAETRAQFELKQKAIKAKAKERAEKIWINSIYASTNHPYFIRKSIKPHGLKLYNGGLVINGMKCDGAIIVPIIYEGEICSLQFINQDGQKRFLPGGKIIDCYFVLGTNQLPTTGRLFVSEGLATAATLNEDSGSPVVISFHSGNLNGVTQGLSRILPTTVELIVACDNDRNTKGNPGMTHGRKAAINAGAALVWPDFPCSNCACSDFNDLKNCIRQKKEVLNEPLK